LSIRTVDLPLAPINSFFLFNKFNSLKDTSFYVNMSALFGSTCTSPSLATLVDHLWSFIKSIWCINCNISYLFNPFGWVIDWANSKSNKTSLHTSSGLSSISCILHSSLNTSLWINFSFSHLTQRPLVGLTSFLRSFSGCTTTTSILALYPLVVTQTSSSGWSHSTMVTFTSTFSLEFFSPSSITFFHTWQSFLTWSSFRL
jgi:hypothetical protein